MTGTTRVFGLLAAGATIVALTGCNVDTSDKTAGDTAASEAAGKASNDFTTSQKNAIASAQSYLSMGSGFSRAGLIRQLTSKMGEGYKQADAVFAVNHVKVDYNKQAVLSAKGYLDMSGFSRAGLIQQLTSKAGDQYTQSQAVYAADKVGL